MIINFEEYTAPLSETEKQLIPLFLLGLRGKVGEKNAVNSGKMERGLRVMGHKVNGARIRKIINHIRINNLLPNLIATSKGYYIETDKTKIKLYVESLRARAQAIMAVADSYEI